MKAILSLTYEARFPSADSPSCSRSVTGFFKTNISIPTLPMVGHVICLPVFADKSEDGNVDDCEVTLIAFDLKKGICTPHIYCTREIDGEEVFEAGNDPDSENYGKAISSALKDLNDDIIPRLKRQGFKKVFTAL